MAGKQSLQDCIDIVNVALGFVQYSNWKPQTMIKRYMESLKMSGKLPKIVRKIHLIKIFFQLINKFLD